MKTSAAGRAAIARREGNKLKAYKDTKGIWTIGVGHTAAAGEPRPRAGMTITAAESDAILERDLANVEKAVNAAIKVPMTQNQFDAMVSLAFNIGNGGFAKSTVVKRLNAGDVAGAGEAFLLWNKPKEIIGRRKQERAQFLSGKPAKKTPAATLVDIQPKPAPAPAPVSDSSIIEQVQMRLTELNYQPGGADGKIGPLTAGAIRIFRADNGLPDGDGIDADFMAALAIAEPRKMVPERANATSMDIASKIPEANSHWWSKYIALGTGAATAAGGAVDQLAPATGYLQPVKDFLGDVPTWAWMVAVVVVAGVIWWNARSGQKAVDEAYRSGDRR